jgi:hypothetical protein
MNGFELRFADIEAYQWLIGLYETHRVTRAAIESWIREHAVPLL